MKGIFCLWIGLLSVLGDAQDWVMKDSLQLEIKDSITDFEADDFDAIYFIRNFSELIKIDPSGTKRSFSNQTVLEDLNTQNVLQITVKSSLFSLVLLDNQLNLLHEPIRFPTDGNFSPTLTSLVDNNYLWGFDPVMQRLVLWNYRDQTIRRQSVILAGNTGDEFYKDLIYDQNQIYLIGKEKILWFDEFANLKEFIPFEEVQQIYVRRGIVYYRAKGKMYTLNPKTKAKIEMLPDVFADYFSINNHRLFVLKDKVVYIYECKKLNQCI